MARRPRFHQSLAVYHVMMRGNNGQPIFFSDEDRCRFCLLMQEGVERFGHSIHAFCFMSNHIHLAIQVGEIPLSRIMQNLSFRYTRYINKKFGRIGHLFQGRFKAVVVDEEGYLKELVRYIHLNPVRAKLVNSPEEYDWSSHNAYLQQREYAWITTKHVLQRFGESLRVAVEKYAAFILLGMGIQEDHNFKSGVSKGIFGDELFVEQILSRANPSKKPMELNVLTEVICSRFGLSSDVLRGRGRKKKEIDARALMALIARESKSLSIEKLAVFLRREPSGLSKLATRLEINASQTPALMEQIQEVRNLLLNQTD
jgi:putative transposase